ncbi:MAG: HAMP domain-containing histidine kinase, partial [Robiginitomaculum sp.]|nr:HAMP domain-containing histidine kinase [Robiginitomaculum sp.]
MTIVFVMLAEILIFIPSAAMFRHGWLQERAEAAGLLTLAIEGVPDYMGGEMLSKQFMKDTGCSMVVQQRTDPSGKILRQTVLGTPPVNEKIFTSDLRIKRQLPLFRESFRDFFSSGNGYIRIVSEPTVEGVDALEILVPQNALKMALRDYWKRVLLWSLAISLLTGLMIYLALSRMIARPIVKLASGLAKFRADPRKRMNPHSKPSKSQYRRDEIGQLEREFIAMKTGIRTAFKQQERLATLGMAMAKINHDLRNVLTSTQLISDRLADDQDPRISKMGKRLVKTVDRGVKLCEATLSFSRSVEDRPAPQTIRLA